MIWRVCRSVNQSVNMRATVCEGEVVGEEEGVLEGELEDVMEDEEEDVMGGGGVSRFRKGGLR